VCVERRHDGGIDHEIQQPGDHVDQVATVRRFDRVVPGTLAAQRTNQGPL
jgi:hypothetical protein